MDSTIIFYAENFFISIFAYAHMLLFRMRVLCHNYASKRKTV